VNESVAQIFELEIRDCFDYQTCDESGQQHPAPELEEIDPMSNELTSPNRQQPTELTTDFLGEDRHEFVAKLAYKHWEQRGRPFGSPEVDWFAAERALYSSLVASGLVARSTTNPPHFAEEIYR